MQEKFISIGKIINFHGIQGEVKVGYSKGKENQLLAEKVFYLFINGNNIKLTISKLRFHKNIAIIKFKELNSIDEVIVYKGQPLFIPIENLRSKLEEDEFLIDDLVGLTAYDILNKNLIGQVNFIDKQANSDLLVINNASGKEFLVPFVKELVPVVDLENKSVYINAIEGLIE